MSEEAESKKAKLEKLNQHLDEVKQLLPQEAASGTRVPNNAAKAAIDFASATAVGSLLGYGFDQWQNTLPWGLIVGLVIGTMAGVKLLLQTNALGLDAEEEKTNND